MTFQFFRKQVKPLRIDVTYEWEAVSEKVFADSFDEELGIEPQKFAERLYRKPDRNGDYHTGQWVWRVEPVEEPVTCPVCNGSGYSSTWSCYDQDNYPCNYCDGKKTVSATKAAARQAAIDQQNARWNKHLAIRSILHRLTDVQLDEAYEYLNERAAPKECLFKKKA